jgi:hypothetical protein
MSKLFVLRNDDLEEIIKKNDDFYFIDGERVPDELRKGFQTTIFHRPWTPPFESFQKAKSE